MNRHRQKKKFLGPGFQVSVSLYLYIFFLSSLRAAETLKICLARVLEEMERLGRSVLGLCGRRAGMVPVGPVCSTHGFIHCGCRRCCAVCLGECVRKGFFWSLGVEMAGYWRWL